MSYLFSLMFVIGFLIGFIACIFVIAYSMVYSTDKEWNDLVLKVEEQRENVGR